MFLCFLWQFCLSLLESKVSPAKLSSLLESNLSREDPGSKNCCGFEIILVTSALQRWPEITFLLRRSYTSWPNSWRIKSTKSKRWHNGKNGKIKCREKGLRCVDCWDFWRKATVVSFPRCSSVCFSVCTHSCVLCALTGSYAGRHQLLTQHGKQLDPTKQHLVFWRLHFSSPPLSGCCSRDIWGEAAQVVGSSKHNLLRPAASHTFETAQQRLVQRLTLETADAWFWDKFGEWSRKTERPEAWRLEQQKKRRWVDFNT